MTETDFISQLAANQFLTTLTAFAIGVGCGMLISRALLIEGAGLRGHSTNNTHPRTFERPAIGDTLTTAPPHHQRARLFYSAENHLPPESDTVNFRIANPDGSHSEIIISRRQLARFVECATPSRAEWRGSPNDYTRCARTARALGWVGVTDGRGSLQWRIGLNELTMRSKHHRRLLDIAERNGIQLA